MRDYKKELDKRIKYIKEKLEESGAEGIVFGNSGGKDSALVGILCKKACENTIGVLMPCGVKRNFGEDLEDGRILAEQFEIESLIVNLTDVRNLLTDTLGQSVDLSREAISNIAPRLRMITLYTIAQSRNLLVAGSSNRSEIYMGYFTKWGDGAYDFNPIADLTVTEVYEFLRFLNAPHNIIDKVPSGGLFEGQTDEEDMGITYAAIDEYILRGEASEEDAAIINRYHSRTGHKRKMPSVYRD